MAIILLKTRQINSDRFIPVRLGGPQNPIESWDIFVNECHLWWARNGYSFVRKKLGKGKKGKGEKPAPQLTRQLATPTYQKQDTSIFHWRKDNFTLEEENKSKMKKKGKTVNKHLSFLVFQLFIHLTSSSYKSKDCFIKVLKSHQRHHNPGEKSKEFWEMGVAQNYYRKVTLLILINY